MSHTAVVTVVGGAGADTLNLGLTTLGVGAANVDLNTTSTMTAGVQLQYSYSATQSSGDKLVLGITSITAGGVNWNANAGASLYVLTNVTGTTGITALDKAGAATSTGDIFVYDSGDDLVIGINADGTAGDRSEAIFLNIIDGDELLKTTEVGNQGMVASNFGFTVSTSGGNIEITFS